MIFVVFITKQNKQNKSNKIMQTDDVVVVIPERSMTKFLYDENLLSSSSSSTKELIYNPYNPLNRKITLHDIQTILIAYELPPIVHNMALYQRAFVYSSYTKRTDDENERNNIKMVEKPDNCLPLCSKSNERLEFIGDGILEAVTKLYNYRRFPKAHEGFMTDKKIDIVKNVSIGKFAYEMGLHQWLIISKHAEEKKTRTNIEKLGCLFEAFIGALYLDMNKLPIPDNNEDWFLDDSIYGLGFPMCQKFIHKVFEKHINWTHLITNNDNHKKSFQEIIQKEFKVPPQYMTLQNDVENGFHMGLFLCVGFNINNDNVDYHDAVPIEQFSTIADIHEYIKTNQKIFLFISSGIHKIKKEAQQMACHKALEYSIFKEVV
jgi:dsRNA-specific ribonuclease